METLGDRIKTARKTAKLTQAEAAEICGVSSRTLATWEHSDEATAAMEGALLRIAEQEPAPADAVIQARAFVARGTVVYGPKA